VIQAYAKRATGERLLINPQGLKRPAEWYKRSTLGREWSAVGGAAGGIAESGRAEDEVSERARRMNDNT
jgi:hypothetical protein